MSGVTSDLDPRALNFSKSQLATHLAVWKDRRAGFWEIVSGAESDPWSSCTRISQKVSSLLSWLYKTTVELTFEKLYLYCYFDPRTIYLCPLVAEPLNNKFSHIHNVNLFMRCFFLICYIHVNEQKYQKLQRKYVQCCFHAFGPTNDPLVAEPLNIYIHV